MLDEFAHDLRSNSLVISFAAHLLKDSLDTFDQEEFQLLLSRNLTNAQAMLESLTNRSWLEADGRTSQVKVAITALSALLNTIRTELTGIVSAPVQLQIDQLTKLAKSLVC